GQRRAGQQSRRDLLVGSRVNCAKNWQCTDRCASRFRRPAHARPPDRHAINTSLSPSGRICAVALVLTVTEGRSSATKPQLDAFIGMERWLMRSLLALSSNMFLFGAASAQNCRYPWHRVLRSPRLVCTPSVSVALSERGMETWAFESYSSAA